MSQKHFDSQVRSLDSKLYAVQGLYRDPVRVRNDLVECLRQNPALQARTGPPGNKPGQAVSVYLSGTVPVFYNGNQYNIPVNIWVVDSYPYAPPLPYVAPTPDMIIKPKHRHVDSAGMVYLPYLSNWKPSSCSLSEVVKVMCKVFGEDPPVRSKPKSAPAAAAKPKVSEPKARSNSSSSSAKGGYEDPGAVIKRNAIAAVTDKLRKELKDFYEKTAAEIDTHMGGEEGGDPTSRANAKRDKLRAELDTISSNYDELNKWLEANDKGGDIDIDAITEPRDKLAQQLLHLVATDAALEDTCYYMEKALQNGTLDLASFLKVYRSLAREQYTKRALMKKVHEQQRLQRSQGK